MTENPRESPARGLDDRVAESLKSRVVRRRKQESDPWLQPAGAKSDKALRGAIAIDRKPVEKDAARNLDPDRREFSARGPDAGLRARANLRRHALGSRDVVGDSQQSVHGRAHAARIPGQSCQLIDDEKDPLPGTVVGREASSVDGQDFDSPAGERAGIEE